MADFVNPLRKLIFIPGARFRSAVSEELIQRLAALNNFNALYQVDTREYFLNGSYNIVATPQTAVDGLYIFEQDYEIVNVSYFHNVAGSGGTTELDVKISTGVGNPFNSIFTTTPKFTSAAVANTFALAYDRTTPVTGEVWTPSAPVTGVTHGVLTATPIAVTKGSAMRVDVLQAMTGDPRNTGITIFVRPKKDT